MGELSEEIERISIESMISGFIATMSKENKQSVKDYSKNITDFIEKFDDDTMLLLYKQNNKAQLVIAKKKNIDSKVPISSINISDILDNAINQL